MSRFNRSLLSAAALAGCGPFLTADTGAGAAVASAPAASAVASPVNAPAGAVASGDAAAASNIDPATGKPKRGRLPSGDSAVFYATEAEVKAAPKPSEKHTPYKVRRPDGSFYYYMANHRNAVQTAVLSRDKYSITTVGTPTDPAKAEAQADDLLASMPDDVRQRLFAKYLKDGNAAAAAALPGAPVRTDTSPEFDAAPANAAASVNASAGKTPGTDAPGGGAPAVARTATGANSGQGSAAAGKTATAGGGKRK